MNASPLLIVNADDFGRTHTATDAIIECFRGHCITSTTAMIWMEDSQRAAQLARSAGLPVGLHLNLTELFTDPETPAPVCDRQAGLLSHFRSVRRWGFNPGLHRAVELAICDQLVAFQRLYGREPSHVDGHHHVQFTPHVLLARTLPRSIKLRRTHTFSSGEKSIANRMLRELMHFALGQRHPTTRYFFSIRQLHPALGGRDLDAKLNLAHHNSVEVMCHPERDDERTVLSSRAWTDRLYSLPTGSYYML
jgi:predicted glycoside hydrolase/deacetylase ChbG (UPF0249 family)